MRRKTTVVRTFRAGDLGKQIIPNLVIRAERESRWVDSEDWAARSREQYRTDGVAVADAIFDHLPGGTVDQVLVRLLDRTASLFRVTHRRKR